MSKTPSSIPTAAWASTVATSCGREEREDSAHSETARSTFAVYSHCCHRQDMTGWAILEWECCIKSSEQGAREGAPFIRDHIIEVIEAAFDDFAGGDTDRDQTREMLGLIEREEETRYAKPAYASRAFWNSSPTSPRRPARTNLPLLRIRSMGSSSSVRKNRAASRLVGAGIPVLI